MDLRVGLISHDFPPHMFGGIASVCYDLACSLSKAGVPTSVFCGTPGRSTVSEESGFRIVRLPYLNVPSRPIWFQARNFGSLLRLLNDCSVLHAVNPQSGAFCWLAKRRLKKPLVTSIHGVPIYETKVFAKSPVSCWTPGDFAFNILEYPLFDFLARTSLAGADSVVVCSYATLNEMRHVYAKLNFNIVSVIYNGVNFDKLSRFSGSLARDDGEGNLSIAYFGRLYWRKGVMSLVEAMAQLKKDIPDLVLNIFGTGPMERKLIKLVSNLNLKDCVRIRGHVPYTTLLKEIVRARVAVLPSLYEAQPVSALEAMALGKPVVAFDFPFAREYIKPGYNGFLARAGDITDLSEKIRLLLQDRKLAVRLGQNGFEYVMKNHNWDVLVERYLTIYRQVLES